MNIIGVTERIKKMCALAKIPVKHMLLNCGLSDKVIDNMSRGSYPSIDKIVSIAEYFHLTVDQLLFEQPNDNDIFWRISTFPINRKLEEPTSIQDCMDNYLIQKGYYVDISEEFRYKYLNLSEEGRKTIDDLLDFTYNKETSKKEIAARDNGSVSSEPNKINYDNIPPMDNE